jgi:hypothetical protein
MTRRIAFALFAVLITISASAGTLDNDSTCDIKIGPAATLLLPYFEVDLTATGEQTTLFTITNVSRYSQIAHVTLWTDWAFPVLNFNIFLAGYDVESINLKDILVRGIVASPAGTGPTTAKSPLGELTLPPNGPGYTNPNFKAVIDCDALPGIIPERLMAAVRQALTAGVYNPGGSASCPNQVGSSHADGNAIGYATIDIVASCTSRLPSDPLYYMNDLLFDNVLIGDYQQIGPHPSSASAAFDAGGNPMVHIRAVPEGGGAGSNVVTELPYTFYDRYTPAGNRVRDRRQPLPSTFAARYIQGGPGAFATNYTIWREGFGAGACGASLAFNNGALPGADVLRFDEHDNVNANNPCYFECYPSYQAILPATSSTSTSSFVYPYVASGDVGGWMYLNLNNGGSTGYSVTTNSVGGFAIVITGPGSTSSLAPIGSRTVGPRPSQNWVTATMFGNLGTKHLVAEFDAASLGNGCTPAAMVGGIIGPAGGVFVCPPATALTNGTTDLCKATNVNPKP